MNGVVYNLSCPVCGPFKGFHEVSDTEVNLYNKNHIIEYDENSNYVLESKQERDQELLFRCPGCGSYLRAKQ